MQFLARLRPLLMAAMLFIPTRVVARDVDVVASQLHGAAEVSFDLYPSSDTPATAYRVIFETAGDRRTIDLDRPHLTISGLTTGSAYRLSGDAFAADGAWLTAIRPSAGTVLAANPAAARNQRAVRANGLAASLESCNSQHFPFVFLNVRLTDGGTPVTSLTRDDFECLENGARQTDSFEVVPPATGGGVRLADVVFLIDTSGSMADEIAAVRNNVVSFAASLAASGIDFRLGLVRFGNDSGANPQLLDGGILTSDAVHFQDRKSVV